MFKDLYEHLVEGEKPNPDDLFKSVELKELIQRILSGCVKNPDGSYSCDGDVDLSDLGLTEIPVQFKEVWGDFHCSVNHLQTLKGSPELVGGCFNCISNKLTNLRGSPKVVEGYFDCADNQLITLDGAPQKVGEGFYCENNALSVDQLRKTVKRSYLG